MSFPQPSSQEFQQNHILRDSWMGAPDDFATASNLNDSATTLDMIDSSIRDGFLDYRTLNDFSPSTVMGPLDHSSSPNFDPPFSYPGDLDFDDPDLSNSIESITSNESSSPEQEVPMDSENDTLVLDEDSMFYDWDPATNPSLKGYSGDDTLGSYDLPLTVDPSHEQATSQAVQQPGEPANLAPVPITRLPRQDAQEPRRGRGRPKGSKCKEPYGSKQPDGKRGTTTRALAKEAKVEKRSRRS